MYLSTGSYDNIKNRIHRLSYRNSGGSIDEASYVTDTSGSDVTVKNRLMAPWKPRNDVTSGCDVTVKTRSMTVSDDAPPFPVYSLQFNQESNSNTCIRLKLIVKIIIKLCNIKLRQ